MARKNLTVLLLAALLAACGIPTQMAPTPTPDEIATQVSLLLTTMPAATFTATQPTETPAPSQTATEQPPTPTSTTTPPAPTETQLPTVSDQTSPDWQDTLESSRSFYLFENDNNRVTHENGHLVLTGLTADGWHGWSLSFSNRPRNFNLEAVFIPQTCSGADLYGLVFRAPDTTSGYFFGVTCDGRYNLRIRDFEDGTDSILIQLTASPAIAQGTNTTNRLGVKAEGDRIGLYANGTLLQEVTNDTFEEGNFGAFVAAFETAGFTVWMDEISLWNLP